MKKINKKLILISSLVIISIFAPGVLFIPMINIESFIVNEYDNGVSLNYYKRELKNGFEGNIDGEYYIEHEFVYTSRNPLKPVVNLVINNGEAGIDFETISLERSGLFGWSVSNYIRAKADDESYNFDEALEIAKTYDLSKENPDPENITVFESPSAEEIQERQRGEEAYQEFLKRDQECEKNSFPDDMTSDQDPRYEDALNLYISCSLQAQQEIQQEYDTDKTWISDGKEEELGREPIPLDECTETLDPAIFPECFD
jgi:hypothetical protein